MFTAWNLSLIIVCFTLSESERSLLRCDISSPFTLRILSRFRSKCNKKTEQQNLHLNSTESARCPKILSSTLQLLKIITITMHFWLIVFVVVVACKTNIYTHTQTHIPTYTLRFCYTTKRGNTIIFSHINNIRLGLGCGVGGVFLQWWTHAHTQGQQRGFVYKKDIIWGGEFVCVFV